MSLVEAFLPGFFMQMDYENLTFRIEILYYWKLKLITSN